MRESSPRLPTAVVVALCATLLAEAPLHAGDGARDTSFDGDGVWINSSAGTDHLLDMTVAEGNLFAVGLGGPTFNLDWWVAKILDDGDAVLVTKGFDLGGFNADRAEAVTPDGNRGVVVAGVAGMADRVAVEVCRWGTATLTLDTSFGTSGCTEFDLGAGINLDVKTIARMPDHSGYVIAGTFNGSSSTEWYVLRLTSGGQLDTSYGFSGIFGVPVDQYSVLLGMDVGSDGDTLLVGYDFEGDGDHMTYVMLDRSGVYVDSFGTHGKEVFGSPADSEATCVSFDGIEPFAVGISVFSSSTSTGTVQKMDTLGDLYVAPISDVTWDEYGTNVPIRILPQGDGSFVVASYYADQAISGEVFAGTRFPCLGCSADSSYGLGGLAHFHPAAAGLGDGSLTTATLWGGRLVVGGYVSKGGDDDWVIVRFTGTPVFADNWETGDRRRWSSKIP